MKSSSSATATTPDSTSSTSTAAVSRRGSSSEARPSPHDRILTLSPEKLRQQIRVRLAQERLPPLVIGIYQTQRGTGRPCLVCRREIRSNETEYYVDGGGVVMSAHLATRSGARSPCHTAARKRNRRRREGAAINEPDR